MTCSSIIVPYSISCSCTPALKELNVFIFLDDCVCLLGARLAAIPKKVSSPCAFIYVLNVWGEGSACALCECAPPMLILIFLFRQRFAKRELCYFLAKDSYKRTDSFRNLGAVESFCLISDMNTYFSLRYA